GRDLSPASAVAISNAPKRKPGGQSNADIFITASLEPKAPYVQQQALLQVKLYRAINTASASLSEPTTHGGSLVIEKLGEDRSYPASHNGKRYQVVERNYALLPQASGELNIDPIQFEGQLASRSRFGFDPFSGGRRVRVESDPITLQVKPIPGSFNGQQWLPAKNLALSAHWSQVQPEFRAGEPVTRVIGITAIGLAASQLPEIEIRLPDGVRSYRDQPVLMARAERGGIISEREDKIAIIPEQPGILRLPAIEIPWWNTTTDQLEIASLPAVEIAVLPALGDNAGSIAVPGNQLSSENLAGSSPNNNQDGLNNDAALATQIQSGGAEQSLLAWLIAAVMAAGWLITTLLWLKARSRSPESINPNSKRNVDRAVQLSCQKNDPRSAATALMQWGKLRYPDQPPPSLEALANREQDPLAADLQELAKSLYSHSASNWSGTSLAASIKSASSVGRKSEPLSTRFGQRSTLEPLNPPAKN
ncbi:MAG: BatD family protein, partial [Immundisolibacteraceae bacterium]|nr:BatD family protein [Immundisolibacteraceae bacterium]